jgi:hypothetical protein
MIDPSEEYEQDLELVEKTILKMVDRLFDKKDYVALSAAIYRYKDRAGRCVTRPYWDLLIKGVSKQAKER